MKVTFEVRDELDNILEQFDDRELAAAYMDWCELQGINTDLWKIVLQY